MATVRRVLKSEDEKSTLAQEVKNGMEKGLGEIGPWYMYTTLFRDLHCIAQSRMNSITPVTHSFSVTGLPALIPNQNSLDGETVRLKVA